MSAMSTSIYDFYLLLLWIPTPIPTRSQYPGGFHPEQLTLGPCHTTVSLLPSSPRPSNLWSLPTRGVLASCPQNSGSRTPQPQRQKEILSSPEIHFPFCTASEWLWEHPFFFLENFSSHTWVGPPRPWGHRATYSAFSSLWHTNSLAMWPCHTQATSRGPSSAWDEATSRPASPTSGQDWCHHLLWVPLCWSRWTSPETRCLSETVLSKHIAKGEKTNHPLWLGGLAGETPIYVTNQEALGFGELPLVKIYPKMMTGILRTLQSQIFPDTKGLSPEIDSSFLPKIHICFMECPFKKQNKTKQNSKPASTSLRCLAMWENRWQVHKCSLSPLRCHYQKKEMRWKGQILKTKGMFSAADTPGSRSHQETQAEHPRGKTGVWGALGSEIWGSLPRSGNQALVWRHSPAVREGA